MYNNTVDTTTANSANGHSLTGSVLVFGVLIGLIMLAIVTIIVVVIAIVVVILRRKRKEQLRMSRLDEKLKAANERKTDKPIKDESDDSTSGSDA